MTKDYDPHAGCKYEIEYWRHLHEEKDRVKQVVLNEGSEEHPAYRVLNIVRVDAFHDGLRVLVR